MLRTKFTLLLLVLFAAFTLQAWGTPPPPPQPVKVVVLR